MKTYFLEGISSNQEAGAVLSRILPGQEQPWLLRDGSGDVVAYLRTAEPNESEIKLPAVVADISGRHFHADEIVLSVLKSLQEQVGGTITDDQ